jgi:hypothetical protein
MAASDPHQLGAVPPGPPPPRAGIGVAAALVVGIAGWIAIGSTLLSEASLFGGLMLLWYWANIEQLDAHRLLPSILGALVGIGLAFGMYYGASVYGPAGLTVALVVLVVAIYLDIVKLAPLFVNGASMLYSIVAAAPLVQLKINWIELCVATVGGGLYFAAYVAVLKWVASRALAVKQ